MQGRRLIVLLQNVLHRLPGHKTSLITKAHLPDARFPSQSRPNIYFCTRLYCSKSDQSNVLQLQNIVSLLKDHKVELPMARYAEICSLADVQVLSSALHFLASNGLHCHLDMLYQAMMDHGYHMGQGVNTTLIRSYLARKMWKGAIDVLNSMEEKQLMKHTRSYNPVITGLAEQGYAVEAFHLFEKKIKMYHLIASKKESISRDTEMFVAMINACCISHNDQRPLLTPLINERDSKVKGNTHSLVLRLFDFFHEFGINLPLNVLQACQRWFAFDPNHSWIWRDCDMNENGRCHLCGVQLENSLPNEYFQRLEKEIIHKLSDLSELKCSHEEIVELKDVHDTVITNGPFDVIIDGQNLGLEGKEKDSKSTKLFGKRLLHVTCHLSKQGKKILLPLHHKALENDISEKLLQALKKHCEIWLINSNINDDLLLLYAVATNGMNNGRTVIVSNDNWRDHSLMLSNDNRLKLLKWARLNRVMFDVRGKSHVSFFKNSFDPVVQRSEYAWHFPVIDGSWRCATLKL